MHLHFFISLGTKNRWDKILSRVCFVILYYNCTRVIMKMLARASDQFEKFSCCCRQIWETGWELPRKNRLWFVVVVVCLFGWLGFIVLLGFFVSEAGSCEKSSLGLLKLRWGMGNRNKNRSSKIFLNFFYSFTSISSDFKKAQDAVFSP